LDSSGNAGIHVASFRCSSITLEATLVQVKDAPEMTFSVAGVMDAARA